jgi:hypothetical protein
MATGLSIYIFAVEMSVQRRCKKITSGKEKVGKTFAN